MPGKVRKCLRDKTLHNVLASELSETDKNCIVDVFVRFEHMLDIEKHGSWQGGGCTFSVHECSQCGHLATRKTNYCPNCGANMLKEGEEE